MLRTLRYISKRDWVLVIISVALIVVQVWLELLLPDYMSDITLLVETEGSEMSEILSAGGKMMLCALGSLVSCCIVSVLSSQIASNYGASLRGALFQKVQTFSMAEIGKFSTASLITRSTNDVTQVMMLIVMGLQMLVKAPIMAVWAIVKIAGKATEWTLTTAAAVVILLIVVGVIIAVCIPKFKKIQVLTDDLNRITRENLTGLRVVRAYNAEGYQESKFEEANKKVTDANLFTVRATSFLLPTITLTMNMLSLAVYWIGAILIDEAELMDRAEIFSDMVVFSQYAVQVVMSFMMLVMIFMMVPRASVSGSRIMEVLDTECSIQDGAGASPDPEKAGTVEFRDVSFRYADEEGDALEHITFTAHPGETVAFIGATGCGKSTVINLVPRFYDATEGEVLVDGVNVKEYTQKDLRNRIGYVSQSATLFKGTISSNITFGDNGKGEPTQEDVDHAIEVAQASDFVNKLDDKSESFVASRGTNYSGGQKQRISIARAICRDPEILIFDDSFSALDYKTDKELRKALSKDCAGTTKLIVAQRIGTIRDADQIVVLDQGKVAGIGKHDELMKTCPVYQKIALSQLSKEELA